MRRPRSSPLGLLVALPLALASCTSTSPAPQANAEVEREPEAPAKVASEEKPDEKVEPEPAKPLSPPPLVVEPPPKPEPAKPLPPLPGKVETIRPVPGEVTWTELPGPGVAMITDFRPFVIGVLAECGGVTCKLSDDNQVIEDPVILPSEKIWGVWRSDAWIVVTEAEEGPEPEDPRDGIPVTETTEYKRWRGREFVNQARTVIHTDADSYYGAIGEGNFGRENFRKGWAGGLLLYEADVFRRLPEGGAPAPTVTVPQSMLAFFEAESGAMFFATVDDFDNPQRFALLPPCASEGCTVAPLQLPAGDQDKPWIWDFPLDIARGGDAMSFVATTRIPGDEDADEQAFLIHYDVQGNDPGRWVVEALRIEIDGEVTEVDAPDQLWPDKRGGFWVELDDELYYRDAKGRWFSLDVPGATAYANRLKPREFLALVQDAGTTKVLATRDAAKPKPAAP